MNLRIAVSILTSFPNFGERFYSKKLRQPLPARGPEDEPRIFQTPSIEHGSFRPLANQNNTEGAPGSSFEPGSWGCLSLFTLPRRSNEEAFAHWQIKITRRVPQVRHLNLGPGVAFLFLPFHVDRTRKLPPTGKSKYHAGSHVSSF